MMVDSGKARAICTIDSARTSPRRTTLRSLLESGCGLVRGDMASFVARVSIQVPAHNGISAGTPSILFQAVFSWNFLAKALHAVDQIFLQGRVLGIAVEIIPLSGVIDQVVQFEFLRLQVVVDQFISIGPYASIRPDILPARILKVFVQPF